MPFSRYSTRSRPGDHPFRLPVPSTLAGWVVAGALMLLPAISHAGMVTGTVLSVEPERQQLTLRLTGGKEEQVIRVQVAGPLPACARPGGTIRVWGSFGPGGRTFSATDVRGPGHGFRNDPTGVRFRLERSLDRNPGRPARPAHRGRRGRMR